jgi:hypothetical protein
MNKYVIDSVTGETYSLEHLKSLPMTYTIKPGGNPVDVELYLHFSNHCYTKSRKSHHTDEEVLFRETKKNGTIDERVFCKERWEFSKLLPEIFRELHAKPCFIGNEKTMFYRQENKPFVGSHEGWYICARFGVSNKHENLVITVRSVHYRTNRPESIRGESKRFYVWLMRFYQDTKRDWL